MLDCCSSICVAGPPGKVQATLARRTDGRGQSRDGGFGPATEGSSLADLVALGGGGETAAAGASASKPVRKARSSASLDNKISPGGAGAAGANGLVLRSQSTTFTGRPSTQGSSGQTCKENSAPSSPSAMFGGLGRFGHGSAATGSGGSGIAAGTSPKAAASGAAATASAAAASSVAAAAASLIVPKVTVSQARGSCDGTRNSKAHAYAGMAMSAMLAHAAEKGDSSEHVIQTPINENKLRKNVKSPGMLSPNNELQKAALTFSMSASLLSRSFLSASSMTNVLSDQED